jgi:hypothetical protein
MLGLTLLTVRRGPVAAGFLVCALLCAGVILPAAQATVYYGGVASQGPRQGRSNDG